MTLSVELTEDLATCHALRHAVFVEEQGFAATDELDGRDGEAFHLLARLDGRPVGTARVFLQDGVGTIGRVCVARDRRGEGIGAAIMALAIGELRAREARQAKLGAQTPVMPFYERLGFEAEGPVYDDAGAPHQGMVLAL